MHDDKAIKFFEEVLSKTKAGKLRWEPTAKESNYIAAVGGHFTLSISEYQNTFTDAITHVLALKDQDGRELTRVTSGDDGVSWADIQELHETARRQALHVDEKIDSVLGELSKL